MERCSIISLSIQSKHSSGHDEISNTLLKNIIPNIVKPLTHICNSSFQTGRFPDLYKIAKIIPVYKNGDKNNVNNYRPISLLTSISKILEKLVIPNWQRLVEQHLQIQCWFFSAPEIESNVQFHRTRDFIERAQFDRTANGCINTVSEIWCLKNPSVTMARHAVS